MNTGLFFIFSLLTLYSCAPEESSKSSVASISALPPADSANISNDKTSPVYSEEYESDNLEGNLNNLTGQGFASISGSSVQAAKDEVFSFASPYQHIPRMGNRKFLANVLESIFGGIENSIGEKVIKSNLPLHIFGGYYDENINSFDYAWFDAIQRDYHFQSDYEFQNWIKPKDIGGDNLREVIPEPNTLKSGYHIKTCEKLMTSQYQDKGINHVKTAFFYATRSLGHDTNGGQAPYQNFNDNPMPEFNQENVIAMHARFNPYKEIEPSFLSKIMDFNLHSEDLTELWQYTLLAMCLEPSWMIP